MNDLTAAAPGKRSVELNEEMLVKLTHPSVVDNPNLDQKYKMAYRKLLRSQIEVADDEATHIVGLPKGNPVVVLPVRHGRISNYAQAALDDGVGFLDPSVGVIIAPPDFMLDPKNELRKKLSWARILTEQIRKGHFGPAQVMFATLVPDHYLG